MRIHTVNKGEVLWEIADYYAADIHEIAKINGLINLNALLEGQSLILPKLEILYTVKYGDTLNAIANRFGVQLGDLISLNKIINPDYLYPGIVLTLPQEIRKAVEVNAYTYVFGESDVQILGETMDYLTYLTPFTYVVRADGRLQTINDEQAIQLALSHNVIPMMSIANFTFYNNGELLAHIILNDMEKMNLLIDNIIFTMKEKGYRGLNVDFENILPEDREAYNNFLHMAASKLHTEGFFISSSINSGLYDDNELLLFNDCESLGRILDLIILINGDWGKISHGPRASIPINIVRKILDYAVTVIPKEKILMGYQITASDWLVPYSDGSPEIYSIQEAMNRAYTHMSKIEYDETNKAPYFHYKDAQDGMHEVWFEDARSAQAKFDLVKEYGLRGISYWAMGYPFFQNWPLLKDNFILIKD